MPDVKTILQKLIDDAGINPTQLARETAVPQPTIWRILKGESKDPDTATLEKIAKRFRKTVAQLRGEVPLDADMIPAGVKLPVISWVAAGRGEAIDPYAPGAVDEWETFDGPFSKGAFALRVRGDSMVMPDGSGFPEGSVIGVEPTITPNNNEFIVVRFNNSDEATFKQLVLDGPFKYLKPLNPRYPTVPVAEDAQLCGVVTEVNLKRRLR